MSTSLRSYLTETKISNDAHQALGDSENKSIFKYTYHFLNYTNEIITIMDRDNLAVPITPMFMGTSETQMNVGVTNDKRFVVRKAYHFKQNQIMRSVVENIKAMMDEYSIGQDSDINILRQSLLHNLDSSKSGNSYISILTIYVDRIINIDHFKSDEVIYEPKSDLLLMKGRLNTKYPHPYSKEGIAREEYASALKDKNYFCLMVEIVDNEKITDNRYMYVANQLMPVPVSRDVTKESGVWYAVANSEGQGLDSIKMKHIPLDKAETLGIYNNKEAAMTGGNPAVDSNLKQIAAQKELELARMANHRLIEENKATLDKRNTEYQTLLLDNKTTVTRLEAELEILKKRTQATKEIIDVKRTKRDDSYSKKDMKRELKRKLENARRDDYFDNRSHELKNTSEVIKYVPAIALGAAAAIAVVYNNRS